MIYIYKTYNEQMCIYRKTHNILNIRKNEKNVSKNFDLIKIDFEQIEFFIFIETI